MGFLVWFEGFRVAVGKKLALLGCRVNWRKFPWGTIVRGSWAVQNEAYETTVKCVCAGAL